jgi:hypothetical protein
VDYFQYEPVVSNVPKNLEVVVESAVASIGSSWYGARQQDEGRIDLGTVSIHPDECEEVYDLKNPNYESAQALHLHLSR